MYGRSYWYPRFGTAVFMIRGNFLLVLLQNLSLGFIIPHYTKKMTLMGFIYCCFNLCYLILINWTFELQFWRQPHWFEICLYHCSGRYTSIGSIHDTVPNALLCTRNSNSSEEKFKPAYLLADGRLERAGRAKKNSSAASGKSSSISNGLKMDNLNSGSMLSASVITVGDEIL